MGLIGPFKPTAMGQQFILTMTDYFSKYVEAVPIKDKSAVSVARGMFTADKVHLSTLSLIKGRSLLTR